MIVSVRYLFVSREIISIKAIALMIRPLMPLMKATYIEEV